MESINDIVARFEAYKADTDRLRSRCSTYEGCLKAQRSEIDSLRAQLLDAQTSHQTTTEALQHAQHELKQARLNVSQLQQAIGRPTAPRTRENRKATPTDTVSASVQYLTDERTRRRAEVNSLHQARDKKEVEKKALQNEVLQSRAHASDLEKKIADLQEQLLVSTYRSKEMKFELEYMKCLHDEPARTIHEQVALPSKSADGTTDLTPSSETSSVLAPFILVLIDGDAYDWSGELFQARNLVGAHTSPAGLAAHRIKLQIMDFILQHPEQQIPLQAKIVVRAMGNLRSVNNKPEFMEKFTEAMPLFDYFNAGKGKERVDSKIFENIALFIQNPACVKMFLAVSKDNGFARCLEQYTYNDTMRKKICLISTGQHAIELVQLGLEEVEWSSVFATWLVPQSMLNRNLRKAKSEEREEKREKALALQRGRSCSRDRRSIEVLGLRAEPKKKPRILPCEGRCMVDDGVD